MNSPLDEPQPPLGSGLAGVTAAAASMRRIPAASRLAIVRADTQLPFDLGRMQESEHPPVDLGPYVPPAAAGLPRVLDYQVHGPGSPSFVWGCFSDIPDVKQFVMRSVRFAEANKLQWLGRHVYLTIDNAPAEAGHTQRVPGFHLDGLQGDEVPVKVPGDFHFVLSSALGTDYAVQRFATDHIDPSTMNVFRALERQVSVGCIERAGPNRLYLMSCYALHAGVKADVETDRVFMRVSFTNTPIHNVMLTINPDFHYTYPIHTTSGAIPAHLV